MLYVHACLYSHQGPAAKADSKETEILTLRTMSLDAWLHKALQASSIEIFKVMKGFVKYTLLTLKKMTFHAK